MGISIPIIDGIFRVIDKLIPDPIAKAQAQAEALRMQQAGEFKQIEADLQVMLSQTEINKVEASTDAFRGGWRPAVGWTCVGGLFYTYLAQPLLAWLSSIQGWHVPPTLDVFDLMILLGGMLGFGGMRSFERIKGKA